MKWKGELANEPELKRNEEFRNRVEDYLDNGPGVRWLADGRIAGMVARALAKFDGERYMLHAWAVMPNHVHALFSPCGGHAISSILQSWKSFTAKEAKKTLGLDGKFWQPEYFDRAIRNERHFFMAREYIENNPVKAGLVAQPQDWPWSSASSPRSAGVPPASR
ncbi:MAG: transposase [Nitrospinae bacterium]|nr:transposase [Nitrospinota bacterium]